MTKIMTRIRFVVLLKVWDGKCYIKIPNILNRYYFIKLLGRKKKRQKTNHKMFATYDVYSVKYLLIMKSTGFG